MKKILFLIIFLISSYSLKSQSVSNARNYIYNKGYKLLGFFAHPMYGNKGVMKIEAFTNGNIYVNLHLTDGIGSRKRINFKLHYNKYFGLFDKIKVLRDDAIFVRAFATLTKIKKWIDRELRKQKGYRNYNKNKVVKFLERELRKTYYSFNGRDLCLFALNIVWLGSK